MSSSSKTKFCSACEKAHPIGTPCGVCYWWKCPDCGRAYPVEAVNRCRCGYQKKWTSRQLKIMTHTDKLLYCPRIRLGKVCGAKLRSGPRDKARSRGLKS